MPRNGNSASGYQGSPLEHMLIHLHSLVFERYAVCRVMKDECKEVAEVGRYGLRLLA